MCPVPNFTVQLETLKTQLEVENRVKDGAESLLDVPTLTVSVPYEISQHYCH